MASVWQPRLLIWYDWSSPFRLDDCRLWHIATVVATQNLMPSLGAGSTDHYNMALHYVPSAILIESAA